ncbi:hypothetical protein COV15_02495 [Candidatus Woesearchaeota archaeon CG10_big_fil_rev_8_21_14_0_10_34_12]|nr:MAG: hypothetical protein COV15_02495 [Candidatus Woesearchaeota archaeon CG10_big_fil_rev_8_21_14_0_10_34_12]
MEEETVKGFSNYTGDSALLREKIKEIIVRTFKLYGFNPAETPIIEFEEFVKGNNEFDEAVSDIFKLKDKGERKLALRYEFTFQLKRIAKNKKLPYKRYQIGEVFRDEPVSSNRFRQFTQCDADIVGSSFKEEAELLSLATNLLKQLGIKSEIQINNRKLLNSVIKSFDINNTEFVIREIDKLDKDEDQVKANLAKFISKDKIVKLLKIFDKPLEFFKKMEGHEELKELLELCKLYKLDVKFKPNLARGLSYYNGAIFEIKTLGIKETIAAGGSYLVNNIPASGISFGLERLAQLAKIKLENKSILIININQDKKAVSLAEKLRKQKIEVTISDKVSKGLEYANSYNVQNVIFLGSEEVKKKKFKLRDMKTGKESLMNEKEILSCFSL